MHGVEHKVKEDSVGGACGSMLEKCVHVFVWKPEGNTRLEDQDVGEMIILRRNFEQT
jgi:hypothetical protein